jgi:hypothetical protein
MSEFFTFGNEGINLAYVVAWKDDPEAQTLQVIFASVAPYSKTFSGEPRQRLLERFWKG